MLTKHPEIKGKFFKNYLGTLKFLEEKINCFLRN